MVSVIVPNYNHAKYLKNRIDSILQQTYHDFEVIILDDCSTDNSIEIIENYRSHPKVMRIEYNTANSGSTFKQWNKGVGLAKGDIIWIAESDDIADATFLEHLVPIFNKNESISLVYCQSFRMNDKGEVTGSWSDWTDNLDRSLFGSNFLMDGVEYIKRFLVHKNTIPNASAVLFKKEVYLNIGGADEGIKYNADWLTWIKVLLHNQVYFFSKPLNYFRYHSESVIAKTVYNKVPDKYFETYDRTMRTSLKDYLNKHFMNNADFKEVVRQNNIYIVEENGREGVFEMKQNKWTGFIKVLKACINARTVSFIKLALKR